MSDNEHVEDLRRSKELVGELSPVIVDFDGEVLAGASRQRAGFQRTYNVDSRKLAEKWDIPVRVAKERIRVNSNIQRKVSREETQKTLLVMAKAFEDQGVPKETIALKVAGNCPFSQSYIWKLLPDEYKSELKVAAGEKGGEAKSAGFEKTEIPENGSVVEKKAEEAPAARLSLAERQENGSVAEKKAEEASAAELSSPKPQDLRKPTVEVHKYKPIETWEHRKAVMTPGISKMDEAILLALQQNEALRSAGWKFEFQKRYCIKEVVSDVTASRGDVEKPLFLDGEVHVGREDRDEANRELLARRLGIPEVLAFSYEGAYSNAKRDEIVAKIVEALT